MDQLFKIFHGNSDNWKLWRSLTLDVRTDLYNSTVIEFNFQRTFILFENSFIRNDTS